MSSIVNYSVSGEASSSRQTELDPIIPSSSDDLETKVGQAFVKWMTEINTESSANKAKLSTEPGRIRQGMWYLTEHFPALKSLGESAEQINTWLTKKKAHSFGYLNQKFFEATDTSSETQKFINFRILDGVLPSDALKAAKQGLSIIECGMALRIAQYGALLDIFGEKKFNILFNGSCGKKMNLGYANPGDQPLDFFLMTTPTAEEFIYREKINKNPEKMTGSVGNRPVKFGQIVYMQNVETYDNKHPHGAFSGFNLICCNDTPGKQRFIGFGFEGTEEELTALFLKHYNMKFSWDDLHPCFKSENSFQERNHFARAYADHQRTSLNAKEGFKADCIYSFNISLIQEFIDLPAEKINRAYYNMKLAKLKEEFLHNQKAIETKVSQE